jgi:hypothetical protein
MVVGALQPKLLAKNNRARLRQGKPHLESLTPTTTRSCKSRLAPARMILRKTTSHVNAAHPPPLSTSLIGTLGHQKLMTLPKNAHTHTHARSPRREKALWTYMARYWPGNSTALQHFANDLLNLASPSTTKMRSNNYLRKARRRPWILS